MGQDSLLTGNLSSQYIVRITRLLSIADQRFIHFNSEIYTAHYVSIDDDEIEIFIYILLLQTEQ